MVSLNIQVSGNFKLLIPIVAVILPFCAYVALYLHIYGEEMGVSPQNSEPEQNLNCPETLLITH